MEYAHSTGLTDSGSDRRDEQQEACVGGNERHGPAIEQAGERQNRDGQHHHDRAGSKEVGVERFHRRNDNETGQNRGATGQAERQRDHRQIDAAAEIENRDRETDDDGEKGERGRCAPPGTPMPASALPRARSASARSSP